MYLTRTLYSSLCRLTCFGLGKLLCAVLLVLGCSSSNSFESSQVALGEPPFEEGDSLGEQEEIDEAEQIDELDADEYKDGELDALQPVIVAGAYLTCSPVVAGKEDGFLVTCDYCVISDQKSDSKTGLEAAQLDESNMKIVMEKNRGDGKRLKHYVQKKTDLNSSASLSLTSSQQLQNLARIVFFIDRQEASQSIAYFNLPTRVNGGSRVKETLFAIPLSPLEDWNRRRIVQKSLDVSSSMAAVERAKELGRAKALPQNLGGGSKLDLVKVYTKYQDQIPELHQFRKQAIEIPVPIPKDVQEKEPVTPTREKPLENDIGDVEQTLDPAVGEDTPSLPVAGFEKKVIYIDMPSHRHQTRDDDVIGPWLSELSQELKGGSIVLEQCGFERSQKIEIHQNNDISLGGKLCPLTSAHLIIWNNNGYSDEGMNDQMALAFIQAVEVLKKPLYFIGDDLLMNNARASLLSVDLRVKISRYLGISNSGGFADAPGGRPEDLGPGQAQYSNEVVLTAAGISQVPGVAKSFIYTEDLDVGGLLLGTHTVLARASLQKPRSSQVVSQPVLLSYQSESGVRIVSQFFGLDESRPELENAYTTSWPTRKSDLKARKVIFHHTLKWLMNID